MATAKKSAKKAVAKKAPARSSAKTTVRRVTASKPRKQPVMKSFARASSPVPFFTFRLTQQTVYWLILAAMILGLCFWVITIDQKVQSIYDEIDAANHAMYIHPAANQSR